MVLNEKPVNGLGEKMKSDAFVIFSFFYLYIPLMHCSTLFQHKKKLVFVKKALKNNGISSIIMHAKQILNIPFK